VTSRLHTLHKHEVKCYQQIHFSYSLCDAVQHCVSLGVIYQHFTSVWHGQSVYQICSKDRTRAGSVGFFNFGWIRFGFQSQVLGFVFFFGFGIRISPQCKSILVCENTKTELIYFGG